jgi:hypothetical protein
MSARKSVEKHTRNVSRRTLIKTGALAAFGVTLSPSLVAEPAGSPLDYGNGAGQTPLDEKTIFPLLAAWLLLTTQVPGGATADAIACVANLSSTSAATIFRHYDASAFKAVRVAFGAAVQEFAQGQPPYNTGQCPKTVDTIGPVASLLGTSAPVLCGPKFDKSARPKK